MATLLVFAILKYFPVFFDLDMFDPIQNTLEDMQLTDLVYGLMDYAENEKVDTNVVLVNIGHLNRAELAGMMDIINEYEPKVIGIDAFFRSPKDPELDFPLAASFAECSKLVLACQLLNPNETGFDSVAYSHVMFNQFAINGFVNVIEEEQSFKTVRLMSPNEIVGNKTFNSLPVEVAWQYDSSITKKFLDRQKEREVIDYKRNLDKYITFDIKDVFKRIDSLKFIRGKAVLMGYLGPKLSIPVTEDVFFTPMNSNIVGKTDPDMYGIVIHANALSMILSGNYISTMSDWLVLSVTFAVVYFNMFLLGFLRLKLPSWYQALNLAFVIGEMLFLSFLFLVLYSYWGLEIKLAGTFFPLIVCVLCFEIYIDSIKPIFLKYLAKLRRQLSFEVE